MDEIEQDDVIEDTDADEAEEPEAEKKEAPKETPEAKLVRIEREAKQLRKKLGKEEPKQKEAKVEPVAETKTGELDDTQLDYLDLKGVTDQDEIDIIHAVMLKTGQTVREALKDDYVTAKLETLRKEKEVSEATPSASKRGSAGVSDNEDFWYQKWEQSGGDAFPENMPQGMGIKLVNRKMGQSDPKKNPYE